MHKTLLIKPDFTIKETLKRLDKTAEKVLLVVNENEKLIGAISDGDIRRAILAGKGIDEPISGIYNKNPVYVRKGEYDLNKVKKIFLEKIIQLIPIVDDEMSILEFITWGKAFSESRKDIIPHEKIDVPVVIMAGGKGNRLEPFTTVLPKPLIPIDDKTIIEHIMAQFQDYGINKYYLTLNYKGEMIKAYFSCIDHFLDLNYVFEDDFFGTAGSLKLLENDIADTFIVSNCDILVKADYADVLKFHKENRSNLTVLSAIQHHEIPYGVIEFKKNGEIIQIIEKPESTVTINTGVYIINRECLACILDNSLFHMTDLIEKLIINNRKVFTYPVNSNDYIDIGQWEEYRKAVEKMKMFY